MEPAIKLRTARPQDLDAIYSISLFTGASGQDASALHSDGKLIGHIYSAPYVVIESNRALVAEDAAGVAGYLVGTFQTDAFAEKLEHDWWPRLRAHYGSAEAGLTAADRRRIASIMAPQSNPAEIVASYQAHIHMNLHTRLRGRGVGTRLLQHWIAMARAAGVPGIHLGANAGNTGGIAFWTKSGFVPLQTAGNTVWFGMRLRAKRRIVKRWPAYSSISCRCVGHRGR